MPGLERGVIVPLTLALGAAVFYLLTLSQRERAVIGQYETVRVLVARTDIPERAVLKEDMVEAAEIPRRFVAQDAFELRTPSDARLIANLVSRVRIPKGNQLGQSALAAFSPEAGLAVKVPPGYRGAALGIDPEMRGLVKPGDRVDVLLTFDALMGDGRREKVTATILQNVLVMSVGRDLGPGLTARPLRGSPAADERAAAFSEKAMITLALNPLELQYLALATQQGSTAIGVRAPGDVIMTPLPMANLRRLFDGPGRMP